MSLILSLNSIKGDWEGGESQIFFSDLRKKVFQSEKNDRIQS
jgi:hypothetical protein